ncbi:hypothetical protein DESC_600106 [Desulfosarcina cetonica]|nr:hypothetical protein DESC_600106 [Desulfosarcina cetonica]
MGGAQGHRGFTQGTRHAMDGILGNTADGRNGHEGQHQRCVEQVQAGGKIEDPLQKGRHQDHAEKSDHHRRQGRQELDHRFDDLTHPRHGDFGKVDRRHHAQGDGHGTGNSRYRNGCDDQGENAEIGRIGSGIPVLAKNEVFDRNSLEDGQPLSEKKKHDQKKDADGCGGNHEKEPPHGTFGGLAVGHRDSCLWVKKKALDHRESTQSAGIAPADCDDESKHAPRGSGAVD